MKDGCTENGAPIACGVAEGVGESGNMLATTEVMKRFRETVALPALLPQKNWRVRGPGGERIATITTVANPSLSVTTGARLDVNDCEKMLEVDVMRSTMLEGTPLVVKTKAAAASYREESGENGGKKIRIPEI